jgi:CBS domain-containing protein
LKPDDPLTTAVEQVLAGSQQDFPVLFGDRVLGVLTREALTRALAQGEVNGHVRDAMNREVVTIDSHDMLETALATMRSSGARALPVVHDGQLVGLLTIDHIGEFLMIQSALRQAQWRAQSAHAHRI